jgi:hypothetical protein
VNNNIIKNVNEISRYFYAFKFERINYLNPYLFLILKKRITMSNIIDFENVSLAGLESSPVSKSLAGLRANESRYFKNKYNHDFTVESAIKSKDILDYVNNILLVERDIKISSKPLETSDFIVEGIKFTYIFYESGLSVNVMYSINDPKKRAVGFKLSEGMEVPKELEGKFKFAKQKSKLAGIIRGSFFVIKGEY